jgi:hypothetical protein
MQPWALLRDLACRWEGRREHSDQRGPCRAVHLRRDQLPANASAVVQGVAQFENRDLECLYSMDIGVCDTAASPGSGSGTCDRPVARLLSPA